MRRLAVLLVATALLAGRDATAQAVPDSSQAGRLHRSFRRTPALGVDPFRYVFWPGWGLMLSGGGSGWNNSVNAADIRAIVFIEDNSPDGLLVGDYLNLIGLVPRGQGFQGFLSGEGGVYLGGPFGKRVSFGITGQGRGYGSVLIEDGVVTLFRDGNANDSIFDFGGSQGSLLATAEVGGHALINLGPVGTIDGAQITFGFGGRYIRPVFYARGLIQADSRVFVTGDSIGARVDVEFLSTVDTSFEAGGLDTSVAIATGGSGIAADFVLRVAWPTSGLALEAMVANLGSVTIQGVQRETISFGVASSSLEEVSDSIDAAQSQVQGIDNEVDLTLPRIVRFSASAWANRILQLDAAATLPVSGEFDSPLFLEFGSTWRLVNTLPVRAGVVLDGRQGIGYVGSVGVEARNFLLRVTGGSMGGLFRNAKGAVGRLEFGFFF